MKFEPGEYKTRGGEKIVVHGEFGNRLHCSLQDPNGGWYQSTRDLDGCYFDSGRTCDEDIMPPLWEGELWLREDGQVASLGEFFPPCDWRKIKVREVSGDE